MRYPGHQGETLANFFRYFSGTPRGACALGRPGPGTRCERNSRKRTGVKCPGHLGETLANFPQRFLEPPRGACTLGARIKAPRRVKRGCDLKMRRKRLNPIRGPNSRKSTGVKSPGPLGETLAFFPRRLSGAPRGACTLGVPMDTLNVAIKNAAWRRDPTSAHGRHARAVLPLLSPSLPPRARPAPRVNRSCTHVVQPRFKRGSYSSPCGP